MPPDPTPPAAPAAFRRGADTWAAYLLLGYFGYLLNGLGPVLPLLRDELGLSYARTSLHSSAFAVGLLAAGAAADRLVARLGTRAVLWGGAAGMAAGVVVLATATRFAGTLAGALVMGGCGALTLVQVAAVLSRRHGPLRGRALTEANAVSSLGGVLAPLAVGGALAAGAGWRPVLLAAIPALGGLGLAFGRTPLPDVAGGGAPAGASARPLPAAYWGQWLVLFCCVGVEFGVAFWAADFLRGVGRLPAPAAALALSGFLGAMLLGRLFGAVVATPARDARLLALSLAVALAGFLVYWRVDVAAVRVAGLVVTGLGVANLYPLALAGALARAPHDAERASARTALASGAAVLVAPFALGALADATSLGTAQAVVPCLILTAAALLAALTRAAARR
jgi:fucose permease